NVVVSDDKLGAITSFSGDANGNGLLDLTETWIYTQTATALAGQQTNTGTVTGRDANTGATVTDDNPAHYFGDAPADLAVTKTDTPDPVTAGTDLTYTVTLTNNGPSDAQGVVLSDVVPAGTTFVSATAPAGWTT